MFDVRLPKAGLLPALEQHETDLEAGSEMVNSEFVLASDPADAASGGAQRRLIASVHHVVSTIRKSLDAPELPSAWVDVLLFIAHRPAEPLASIVIGSGLNGSSAQKVLLALGAENRFGKPGLGVIEDIADPLHGKRKLYFLSVKGRALMAKVLTSLTGDNHETYNTLTSQDFLDKHKRVEGAKSPRVLVKSFSPQEVATGKRSLLRKGIQVGPHIVAFPLTPADAIIDEIDEWVREQGGCLHRLPNIGKPRGMAIADLPIPQEQVHFHLRWRTGI